MKLIELNIQQIMALCKRYKVSKLFVFGYILTHRFNDESDIDLLVEFNKTDISDYFSNFFDFKYAIEELLEEMWISWRGRLYKTNISNQILIHRSN